MWTREANLGARFALRHDVAWASNRRCHSRTSAAVNIARWPRQAACRALSSPLAGDPLSEAGVAGQVCNARENEPVEQAVRSSRIRARGPRLAVERNEQSLKYGTRGFPPFIGVHLDGKDPEVLAAELSCTVKAVQRREARGRKKIREHFKEMGLGSDVLDTFASRQRWNSPTRSS